MRFYRISAIDEMDRIENTRFIEAGDDAVALAQARAAVVTGTAVGVWDQRRLVGRKVSRLQHMPLIAAEQLVLACKQCSSSTTIRSSVER